MMQLVGHAAVESAREANATPSSSTTSPPLRSPAPNSSPPPSQPTSTSPATRCATSWRWPSTTTPAPPVPSPAGSGSPAHANTYRDALIKAGVIIAPRHGYVTFSDHWLRAVLRALPGYDTLADAPDTRARRITFDATQQPPTLER